MADMISLPNLGGQPSRLPVTASRLPSKLRPPAGAGTLDSPAAQRDGPEWSAGDDVEIDDTAGSSPLYSDPCTSSHATPSMLTVERLAESARSAGRAQC